MPPHRQYLYCTEFVLLGGLNLTHIKLRAPGSGCAMFHHAILTCDAQKSIRRLTLVAWLGHQGCQTRCHDGCGKSGRAGGEQMQFQ